jgi:hypothetical protein
LYNFSLYYLISHDFSFFFSITLWYFLFFHPPTFFYYKNLHIIK